MRKRRPLSEKIALIRKLKERGYTAEQVIHLYKVVDFMMTLSQEMEQLVKQVVRKFGEESEWPLTSLEELAIEEGGAEGDRAGLAAGHRRNNGSYPRGALWRRPAGIGVQSVETLQSLSVLAVKVATLDEFLEALESTVAES